MEQAIIDQTIKALERNHFEVYFANNRQEARDIFFQEIFDKPFDIEKIRKVPVKILVGEEDTLYVGRLRNDESHGNSFRDRATTGMHSHPDFSRRLQPGPENILAPPSPPRRFIRHGY